MENESSWYSNLVVDGSLRQALDLLEQEKGDRLNTLLSFEQMVSKWGVSLEEVHDRIIGLSVTGGGVENNVPEVSPDLSCLLKNANTIDVSFKALGFENGLEYAQALVDKWQNLVETASHTVQERSAAFASLRGRPWYSWTRNDVAPMIALLRENALCRADNVESLPPSEEISEFTKFLNGHWGINAYLDPYLLLGDGTAMLNVGPTGATINPIAPGWSTAYTTDNRAHALIRAGVWRAAGLPMWLWQRLHQEPLFTSRSIRSGLNIIMVTFCLKCTGQK